MAITNANQIIDIKAISDGCSIIEAAAQDYIACSKKVLESAEICSAEALSVEKTTMQPTLQDLSEAIKTIQENIEILTAQIRNAASQVYAQQASELAAYEAQLAQSASESSN